jgi:zinc transporter ZupT
MNMHSIDWPGLLALGGVPVGVAMLGGVIGGVSTLRNRRITGALIHFAAGAFLGVALLHLLPEAAETVGWLPALLAAAGGGLFTALIGRWAGSGCPACEAGPEEAAALRLGTPFFIVVALHSGLDGIPLAGTGSHHTAELFSMAVLFHKLPEGMAIAALSRAGGRSLPAALGLTAAIESCTLVGLAFGVVLGLAHGPFLGLGLGAVAGSFLCLVGLSLVGIREATQPLLHAGVAAGGAFVILVARLALC